ncbi:LysM peptidoglycan-binding domain-containing protein [Bradyrhizobium glycinis]|uniref:LysM peptidoglycan-binding domain-containing protein n=1 Tax=Bradyrhizobium glycinis TaxID=2751812 RepID=UPI0018D912C1|nr:LysM domain-containing protein [Bradyrhizobium glycinis]MBH5369762.1 LysM peptidoglycan-binding domain-containing protein [Bradyrhizobium glycinis]
MNAILSQIAPTSAQGTLFGPASRYFGLATTSLQTRDGQTVIYLTRRFLPQADQLALLQTHRVVQGERLDNIAAQFLGDPEAFWRLCDANNAMRPNELTETIGRQLRITLPQGIPQR